MSSSTEENRAYEDRSLNFIFYFLGVYLSVMTTLYKYHGINAMGYKYLTKIPWGKKHKMSNESILYL